MSDVAVEVAVDRKFTVVVIYNGIKKPVKVTEDELIKAVLAQAILEFGPLPNPHTLSLFTLQGQELNDNLTVKQAELHPGEELLLRPSQVKGGSR